MARPRIQIDITQFEKLCALLCTEEEIASYFNCSVDTIEKFCKRTYGVSFAEIYKQKSGNGKIALRRYQMQLAQKYPAMAIFLGKQYLGQRDIVDKETETVKGSESVLALTDKLKARRVEGVEEPTTDDKTESEESGE